MESCLVNLFIVATPRHWLLGVYLKLHDFIEDDAVFLLEPSFPDHPIYRELLGEMNMAWSELPRSGTAKKLREVSSLFKSFNIGNVFSGSINDPHVQYAAHLLHKKDSTAQFYLLDDGLFSYQPTDHRRLKAYKLWERKIRFGFWYQRPTGFKIAAPWVDSACLLFPERLSETVEKPIHSISLDWALFLEKFGILSKLAGAYDLDVDKLKQLDWVLVLDLFKNGVKTSKDYQVDVLEFLQNLDDKGFKFAVKYHPRDKQDDPFRLKSEFPDQMVIPGGLPFEVLSYLLPKPTNIAGDVSTVLLELKTSYPTKKIWVSLIGSHDLTPLPLLKKTGVEVVQNYRFLIEMTSENMTSIDCDH